jgi:hypothetical protein
MKHEQAYRTTDNLAAPHIKPLHPLLSEAATGAHERAGACVDLPNIRDLPTSGNLPNVCPNYNAQQYS